MSRFGYGDARRLVGDLFDSEQSGPSLGHDAATPPGYEMVREIGRGSGGVVYEARSVATDRPVAIKVLHATFGERVDRAYRELDALSQIRSPVVPQVLDYGVVAGRLYIVTDLIEGQALRDHAEDLDTRERVRLLADLADCVQVLHEHGVIHRDLKPSNVIVTETGRPVVVDLGVAALVDPGLYATMTAEGAPVGTPAFMSPEQARGDRRRISTRSDVYALGAMGYELLTGQTPHRLDGTVLEAIGTIASSAPRDPLELRPRLPGGLAAVLRKACAAEVAERYDSAASLAADLRRWLRREPVLAGRQGAWTRCCRWVARHPIAATIAACGSIVVLTLALTAGAVAWLQRAPYEFDNEQKVGVSKTALLSRSGKPIREFRTATETGIRYGGSLLRGEGGTFAVLAFFDPEVTTGAEGLVGFDTRDLDRPAWTAAPRVPDSLAYAVGGRTEDLLISPTIVECVDVFAEIEGPEIVAVYRQRANSVAIVQVLSADGRVLFDVAHDGWLDWMSWNPHSRQILLAGVCSDATITERGAASLAVMRYPLCVMAIDPELGSVGNAILAPERGDGYRPTWYKVLLPLDAYADLDDSGPAWVEIKPAPRSTEEGRKMSVVTIRPTTRHDAHAAFVFDEAGNLVEGMRASDSWNAEPHLAAAGPLRFGDLPPIQPNSSP